MKNRFSALWRWCSPSGSFTWEWGTVPCHLPAISHCCGSNESSHFCWCFGNRKHVRISVSVLKSLICDINTSLKVRKTNKQPESPRRTPLPRKEWKSLPPCPPKLLPWFCRGWLPRVKCLGLTVLQTQMQNKSCGCKLHFTGKLQQFG